MNEVWTEVMFIDRWIGESWSTYYIGKPSEVEEALETLHPVHGLKSRALRIEQDPIVSSELKNGVKSDSHGRVSFDFIRFSSGLQQPSVPFTHKSRQRLQFPILAILL